MTIFRVKTYVKRYYSAIESMPQKWPEKLVFIEFLGEILGPIEWKILFEFEYNLCINESNI